MESEAAIKDVIMSKTGALGRVKKVQYFLSFQITALIEGSTSENGSHFWK